MKKKGVSPIVATFILIAIVVILAVIIFLWARGFTAERAQKFGRAVELSCDESRLIFQAGLYREGEDCILEIVNNGEIPIYGFQLKDLSNPGVVIVSETLQGETVTIGNSRQIILEDCAFGLGDEVLVVPIILGETDSGNLPYTCQDKDGFGTYVK